MQLTAERLRSVIRYDAGSGEFYWKSELKLACGRKGLPGAKHNQGYVRIGIDGSRYLAHRLAWLYMTGEWPKAQIDHINGNRADNRFANLREASWSENMQNAKIQKNNKCGFKGVNFHKSTGRWVAQIQANGVRKYLGLFDTPEDAHAAYSEAAMSGHREFARVR